ncbi:receptor-like protein EIX1 [Humulus lupulus]|uniref:receptor-like protein EIX1 n=1 Tax=Humulus lupulus TaxID=3486 RepID=UPI002B40092B|nr:receptor-like protein EIX1 [Humulus lupulus]
MNCFLIVFPHTLSVRVAVVLVLELVLVLVNVWSITSSNEERSGQCIESERQALLGFKKGLVDRDNRLSSCCTWKGIRCDNLSQTHHIVVLNLGSNYLHGEIGPSLIELKQLRHLDLSFTIIPKFIGSLTRLRYLYLDYNPFIGAIPSRLGNLTRLHSLYLGCEGQLKADNLKWLSRLTSLRDYSLWGIDLSKAIDWFQSIKAAPSLLSLAIEFCQLPQVDLLSPSNKNSSDSLTNLFVFDSSIHPTTVPSLFNVSINLVNLTLYFSNVRGPIPNSFKNMRNLEKIYLRGIGFEGEIPNSLRNLCTLKQLSLIGNIFNTTLHDFLEWLSGGCTKDSLEILDLSSNQLRGSIPEMNSFPIFLRELRIGDNLMKGPLPSLSKLPYLRALDVSSNSLSGLISEVHFHNLSNLEKLHLSSNSLAIKFNYTWIPPFQLTSIGLSSCKLGPNEIHYLVLSHNEIKDTIPMN